MLLGEIKNYYKNNVTHLAQHFRVHGHVREPIKLGFCSEII